MGFQIGKRAIGKDSSTFVIAEIGNNHNGSLERAKELVDLAVDAGADCVKFQLRNLEALYRKKSLSKDDDDLGSEYIIDLLRKYELSAEQHLELFNYCKQKEVEYICTPWDTPSADELNRWGVSAFKVASADFTNLPLIEHLISFKKPLILSTGMSSDEEIRKVVAFLKDRGANFAVLHCNSTYPAPFHAINLNYLKTLSQIHSVVGYSGHERGIAVSLAAVALGSQIIERHLTLDRHMEGPDHAASLEPKDFAELVKGIREIEPALGSDGPRQLSQGELINRENLAKSVVASRPIKTGDTLKKEDLLVKSPGKGLSPLKLTELIGRQAKRDLDTEDYFFDTDLLDAETTARSYSFTRPWGIPIRFHDARNFIEAFNPPLVEFHFSYNELNLNPENFLDSVYPDIDFVVHAPELFQNSVLMDLAATEKEERAHSIQETQRVIDLTRKLKKFFPKTQRPVIVANIGGFSMDDFIPASEKDARYELFFDSLSKLDLEGVELTPQTMAPFPWHFGGQRYQNLFVLPDEIAKVCSEKGIRICLDVSHSTLTSNYFKINFEDFVAKTAPYTAHIHMGDASGVDGEGIQVGTGEINFKKLCQQLQQYCPQASFIPEIWQGHKNMGQEFRVALERLEEFGL